MDRLPYQENWAAFPPENSGGLIEALMDRLPYQENWAAFPPENSGGLIEASA